MKFGSIKLWAVNAFGFLVAHPPVFGALLGIILLLIAFGVVFNACEGWKMEKLGSTANNAAANGANLEQKRQEIRANANRDLQEIRREKEQSNGNLNKALNNVNAARSSRNGRNVGADELEREAERYRNDW